MLQPSDVQNAESFNTLFDSAEVYQEGRKRKEIDDKINEIMLENTSIAKEIGDNVEGNWDELVVLEQKYKVNEDKINSLLADKDEYVLTAKRDVDYDSLDSLAKEVEDLGSQFQEVSNVSVIGDIENIRYPLNAETQMTSPYGNRLDPITGDSISFHAGIDLSASIGTEVLALFNGKVVGTGYGVLGGNYVRIDHGVGIISYYCHLSEIKCNVGDVVNQYDVIALSGNTGTRTTGPHLHLGLYINGKFSRSSRVIWKVGLYG